MWDSVVNSGSQQQMDTPKQSSPLDQVRDTQQTPAQAGRFNGEQPVSKSDEDAVWEGIIGAGNRSNVL